MELLHETIAVCYLVPIFASTDSIDMERPLYLILVSLFLSSLADNALLIVAISSLHGMHAPAWMTPALREVFVVSYVVLGAFAGPISDAFPKARVMFCCGMVKIAGCLAMLHGMHPLQAYCIVGLGACFYSPAKFGLIAELVPSRQLVKANAWSEGLTVISIIAGTAIGGQLVEPRFWHALATRHVLSFAPTGDSTGILVSSLLCIAACYAIAATLILPVPDTGFRVSLHKRHPAAIVRSFLHSATCLWNDSAGHISLLVTTLFWGAGAVMQFIVLRWAQVEFHVSLGNAALFQALFAIGVPCGALAASRLVALENAFCVLPLGAVIGVLVAAMQFVHLVLFGCVLLFIAGFCAGFFVVPMNALLQYRGKTLLSTGQSVAVQNFSENAAILLVLGGYSILVKEGAGFNMTSSALGAILVAGTCIIVWRSRQALQRQIQPSLPSHKKHGSDG